MCNQDLANTGNLIFQNESAAIREEAQKLKAQGANIIIAITHCGYNVDKLIAQHAADDVDVIVGSHSHTFLYTGDKLPGPDTPYGPYPTEVVHENGHRILIVQAAAYAKYVGNITVYFDDEGNVVDYSGAPIYMGSSVPQGEYAIRNNISNLFSWNNFIWSTNIILILLHVNILLICIALVEDKILNISDDSNNRLFTFLIYFCSHIFENHLA